MVPWLLTGAPEQRYWQNRETANVGLDSSVGRAPARQSEGCRFKSRSSKFFFVHPNLSNSSSATFGDQYYRLKDLLYPKSITHTRLRDRLYPKSTTLLPLCLLNNWFSSVSTHSSPPTTRILVSQFPPARLNELILHSRDAPPAVYLSCSISQSPAFSWGRSELTDRNVELYPQFFLELITTQLRFYMVSPQFSLLIILTMRSYKFYLIL